MSSWNFTPYVTTKKREPKKYTPKARQHSDSPFGKHYEWCPECHKMVEPNVVNPVVSVCPICREMTKDTDNRYNTGPDSFAPHYKISRRK